MVLAKYDFCEKNSESNVLVKGSFLKAKQCFFHSQHSTRLFVLQSKEIQYQALWQGHSETEVEMVGLEGEKEWVTT